MPDPMNTIVGAIAIGIPAYIVIWLALRRQARAIFLFGVVLLAVGIGYLSATGTTADIGRTVIGMVSGSAKPAPAR